MTKAFDVVYNYSKSAASLFAFIGYVDTAFASFSVSSARFSIASPYIYKRVIRPLYKVECG